MNFFNLFSKKSKSPLESKIFFVRDSMWDQLSKVDNPGDVPQNSKHLENQYRKFILTILSGSLISLKYKRTQNLSNDDPLLKQLFRIIFKEATLFQEKYLIPDAIDYDILAHDRLKDRNHFLLHIVNKFDRYSEDIEYGLKTNEPYYLEAFDDPDSELSGYKNYFLFLKDLFFIETGERSNAIEIRNNYNHDNWERLGEFFPFVLKVYLDI